MSPEEFIKEHKRLVKILMTGTNRTQKREAKKQQKELQEFMKKHKKQK